MTPPSEFCASCGKSIPSGVQFCPECGAIVAKSGASRDRLDRPFDVPAEMAPPPGGPPERRGPGALLALVPVIVILLIAVMVYLLWPSGSSQTIPVPGEPAPTPMAVAEAPTAKPTTKAAVPTVAPVAVPTSEPPAEPPPPPARESEPRREEARPGPSDPDEPPPPIERPRGSVRQDEPERHAPPDESLDREPTTTTRPAPRDVEPSRPRDRDEGRDELPRVRWYRMRFKAPLFAEASETGQIVTYLQPGTRIRVTGAANGFLKVESVTGKPPGYVSRDDAIPESTAGNQ